MADNGARVTIMDIDPARLEPAVAKLRAAGVEIEGGKAWQAHKTQHGYGAIQWPAEYGGRGVRVNAVAPGPTRTRMMESVPEEMVNHLAALAPAARVAEPEELAAAIVFLATDDASFVHGVTLAVDGGRVVDVTPAGGDV